MDDKGLLSKNEITLKLKVFTVNDENKFKNLSVITFYLNWMQEFSPKKKILSHCFPGISITRKGKGHTDTIYLLLIGL